MELANNTRRRTEWKNRHLLEHYTIGRGGVPGVDVAGAPRGSWDPSAAEQGHFAGPS